MIVVNLIGGLGNQMFQYAAGLSAAQENGVELRMYLGDFACYGKHNGYELGRVFNITDGVMGSVELKKLLGWRSGRVVRRILYTRWLKPLRGGLYYTDDCIDSSCFSGKPNLFMYGYWQSEDYFVRHKRWVREKFQFRGKITDLDSQCIESMRGGVSVSIHIRRGDYLSEKKNKKVYARLGLDYYAAATKYFVDRYENVRFYVFSDDICWAKENLQLKGGVSVYMDGNGGGDSYKDMMLMSHCTHNIIANSSFSWWGAWLNDNENKQIVAPARWFNSPSSHFTPVPDRWISI